MFYFFSDYAQVFFGFNIFRYITFRAGMAAVTAFLLCMILGPIFIRLSKERRSKENNQRADEVRQNGDEAHPDVGERINEHLAPADEKIHTQS